jgi:hypothetical protein
MVAALFGAGILRRRCGGDDPTEPEQSTPEFRRRRGRQSRMPNYFGHHGP